MRGCRGRDGRRKQRAARAHRLRRKAKLRIALNLEVSVRLVLGMLLVNELGPIALVRDEALSRVLRAAGAGVSASAAASLAARHAAQHERSVCWAALHSYTTKLERRTSIRLSATPVARARDFWTGSKKTVQVGIGPISPNQIFSDSAPCGKVQVTWILLPELYSNVKPDCKSDCTTKGYLTS